MTVFSNIRGTLEGLFRIGLLGPTIYQGTTDPTLTPPVSIGGVLNNGDLYIRARTGDEALFQLRGGLWKAIVINDALLYGYQPLSPELNAITSLNTTGLITRTGTGTVSRTILGTASQIGVSAGDGVVTDPTISLAPNPILPGNESMSVPGGTTAQEPPAINKMIRYDTDTHALRVVINGTWRNLLTDAASYQTLDGDLTALAAIGAATGLYAITAAGTSTTRTITGTANQIAVADGAGIAANPTISLVSNPIIPGTASITMPVGTTAQEPAASNGMLRYDSTTNKLRAVRNGAWKNVAADQFSGFRNLLIGADFSRNPWRRGTTFTSVATGTYLADRWRSVSVGTAVVDVLKTADAPTVAQADYFTQHCLHVDVTTAQASITAPDIYQINQRIEGYYFVLVAQRPFTVSFWVKATKIGTYCVAFRNSGTDRSYVAEYTVLVTDTWERKTVSVLASPSGGTWDYTTGVGLSLRFVVAAGSSFQTTAGAWQTGNFLSTSNQVNGLDSTANNFKIALPQLESGDTDTPFEQRPFRITLALCQRYYWNSFPSGTAPAQSAGTAGAISYATGATGIKDQSVYVRHPVQMRATPAITFYNPSAAAATWRNLTDVGNSGAASVGTGSSDSHTVIINAQVATDAEGEKMAIHIGVDAEL